MGEASVGRAGGMIGMKIKKRVHKFGRGALKCRRCGRYGGIVRRYDLMYCRQCFREVAKGVGFKKYN